MRFMSTEEAAASFERLGFERENLIRGSRAESRLKTSRYVYDNPRPIARSVAEAIVQQFGVYSNCLVWRFGKGLGSPQPRDVGRYADWRRARGEMRPLEAASGHVFETNEAELAAAVIEWALLLSWNTLMTATPGKPIIRLFDGDKITIFSRSSPTALRSKLEALDLTYVR
jgi:hypothetical protein